MLPLFQNYFHLRYGKKYSNKPYKAYNDIFWHDITKLLAGWGVQRTEVNFDSSFKELTNIFIQLLRWYFLLFLNCSLFPEEESPTTHNRVPKFSSMSMRKIFPAVTDIFRNSISQSIRASPEYLNFCDANPNSLKSMLRQIVWFENSIYF